MARKESMTAMEPDIPIVSGGSFPLRQNHPNPFNPATEIRYVLPADSRVRLEIFNALGRKVATVVDGWQEAGARSVRWDAGGFPSGI